MNTVEVKDQVHLPLARCFELVLTGIRFRLFRAAITVAIISLAVAFLTTMLTESLVARTVATAIDTQVAPRKQMLFWVARMSEPATEEELTDQLITAGPQSLRRKEFMTWGGIGEADVAKLQDVATRQQMYLRYFSDDLLESDRQVLFEQVRGHAVLVALQSPRALKTFKVNLGELGKQMPTSVEEFEAFLKELEATEPLRRAIQAGHRQALAGIGAVLKGRKPTEVLAGDDEALVVDLAGLGYQMSPGEREQVRVQALVSLDAERLQRTLTLSVVKQRLANRTHTKVTEVTQNVLFRAISSTDGAEWLVGQMAERKAKLADALNLGEQGEQLEQEQRDLLAGRAMIERFDYTPERITQVAKSRLHQEKLAKAEALVAGTSMGRGFMGFPPRTTWLMIVSFLVCIVGITNAMLMSVTDRFTEIATMKCLGATDGFIMLNFVLESCMQGIAGGVVGAILGLLLGALRSGAVYGWIALSNFPLGAATAGAGAALVIGVMISALAAVYPAWVAARLAPMEAMRIE